MDVPELTTTPVAAVPPKLTVAPLIKFVPVIVTDVPPAEVPWVGLTEVTVGGEAYVYWSAGTVADLPAIVEPTWTLTSTVPEPAGAVAVIVVGFVTLNVAVVLPNLTVVAEERVELYPAPTVMATDVPPAAGPPVGLIETIVSASSFWIVPKPEFPPIVDAVGLLMVTAMVSSASMVVSPQIVTGMFTMNDPVSEYPVLRLLSVPLDVW